MIEYVIQKLIALLPTFGEITKENREIRQKALTGIALALNETYLYYNSLERGESRNYETEAKLSRCWAESAVHISLFDKNLAEICENKSDYWINPDNWPDERVLSTGIELNAVREKYRDLLLNQ